MAHLAGLSPARLLVQQGPATPQPAAGRLGNRALVYDELWTARRVWSILATPAGQLIDLAVLDRRTWQAREKGAADAHLFRRAETVHDAAARQAVRLLRAHPGPDGRQVALHVEYPALLQALRWRPAAQPYTGPLDDRTALNEHRFRFTAAPYVVHEYPRRGWREVLRTVRAARLGSEQEFAALLELPLTQWTAHPLWQRLRAAGPGGQSAEHYIMSELLRDALLLRRLLQGRHAEVRAALDGAEDLVPRQEDASRLLGALFARRPGLNTSGGKLSPAALKRERFWEMLDVVRPLLETTLAFPPLATPRHPQLRHELATLLRDALHLSAPDQRLRTLAALQAQEALRGRVWLPAGRTSRKRTWRT
ncbi:hypothetical protein [Deinococcus sp. NW-56]|uniref:hypothetical protein n=1 Tax=Deinococcus sp. NW-56 TaxID=2080419 RepID=UPI00131A3C5C|nr:hypothetical protein [Deinococcus sp. NW-56]